MKGDGESGGSGGERRKGKGEKKRKAGEPRQTDRLRGISGGDAHETGKQRGKGNKAKWTHTAMEMERHDASAARTQSDGWPRARRIGKSVAEEKTAPFVAVSQ